MVLDFWSNSHCHGSAWLLWGCQWFQRYRWENSTRWPEDCQSFYPAAPQARPLPASWTLPTAETHTLGLNMDWIWAELQLFDIFKFSHIISCCKSYTTGRKDNFAFIGAAVEASHRGNYQMGFKSVINISAEWTYCVQEGFFLLQLPFILDNGFQMR